LHLDENDIASPPELKDGSLVSGNTLLRDRAYFPDFHQTNDERCRAGEMEAAGFARACELTGCAWLTVRGISDYGDERKGDEFQNFAAVNAAVALRQLLDRNIRLKVFPRHRGVTPDFDLSDSLESSLVEEYSKANWNFVVEIGSFLSRPLWLSGKLELRKRIGELVEDAAANGERISDRARALIDDVGWTSMAMGQINKARKAISDGLRIAREAANWYLSAKACRHLASISRQEGDLEACGTHLAAAECYAADISNPDEKSEMTTSLLVSRAKLMIALGEAKDAISGLEAAQRQFESAGDYLRAAKTYHSLGTAYLASGEEVAAVAAYERGYRLSMKLGRRDEALANASALATLSDNLDPEGALEWAYKAVEVASELADARLSEKVMTILTRKIGTMEA
jgi:tetratricopeptide (TPR) repeat protein